MRLQYTSSSPSSSSTSLAAGLSPCLLPGPGSALTGSGCSCCWGCCYGALLFFLWTSAAVTASSSSSSSSSAGGPGAGGGGGAAAVTGAPGGSGGGSGAAAATAASPSPPAPPLPAAVVAGGALLAALAAGAGGGVGVVPSGAAGGPVCYFSPTVGSVQELAQRSRVVIEGKVQQQQHHQQGGSGAEGGRRKLAEEGERGGDLVTSGRRKGQVVRDQVYGEEDREQTVPGVSIAPREDPVTVTQWIAPSSSILTTTASTIIISGFSDLVPLPSAAASPAPAGSSLESYLVKVHQVWAVKSGGLEKDSVITLLGDFGSSCVKLKQDSRYLFFMDPTNTTSVFRASFPPLESGRKLKKDVGKVLCRGCVIRIM
ncbi:Hypothetical predicted protein [Pelobates cultripes]|uniref:Neuregulin 2 N-terminal domain-containing protein n=1 Tax=Pelobates cultripes TaxID=61616 RepID=A0AAD1W7S5_PELCU|nr:Hypothetical predicted protein [Pelobates cultripes]